MRARAKKKRRWDGPVGVSFDGRVSKWQASCRHAGKKIFLGKFARLEDARIAADRVTLGLHLDRPLNFPGRQLAPATPAETRAWAKQLSYEAGGRRPASEFHGVTASNNRFRPCVKVDGRRMLLGAYEDARDAAIVRDRAVLFLGLPDPLNLPKISRKLGPASPEQLRREATITSRRGTKSAYIGIVRTRNGGWNANISIEGRRYYVAGYPTEEEAARAFDRAALAYRGPSAILNFPNEKPRPATLETLRREAAAIRANTPSRVVLGVERMDSASGTRWKAHITISGKVHSLGWWPTENQAAIAHDRAALLAPGMRRKLNFPADARRLGPATIEELRAEAQGLYKATTTSRFRGVCWATRERKWLASIRRNGRTIALGLFDDEERAAITYDEAACFFQGDAAKLNFPDGAD